MKWLTHLSQKPEQALKEAEAAITQEKQALNNTKNKIEHTISEPIEQLDQQAKDTINTVENTIQQQTQEMEHTISHDIDQAKADAEAIETRLKTTADAIEQKAEQTIDTVKNTVDTLEQNYEQAKQHIDQVSDTVKTDINKVKQHLNDDVEKAHEAFNTLESTIQDKTRQAEAKLEDLIHNKPAQTLGRIKQRIKQFYSTASGIGQTPSDNTLTPSKHNNWQWQHLALLAIINIVVYLAHTGVLSNSSLWLYGEHIDAINRAYLHTASADVGALVGILSASKMVLSVLQSSQGGISFIIDIQIQLGQLLSPLIDTINYAWKFSIASLSAIELLKFILDTNKLSMVPALSLLFILLGIRISLHTHFSRIATLLTQAVRAMVFVVVLSHVLIPLSLYATASLGTILLGPYKTQVNQGFSDFHRQLPQHNAQAGLKDQVKSKMVHFQQHDTLHQHSSHLIGLTVKHLVVSLIEYLISPFALMFGLIKLCLWQLRPRAS